MASATTRASCQAPVPSTSTRRSPTAIPSVTPTITSIARRPRWPSVSPSVMIADTGAKNGWAWPDDLRGDQPRDDRGQGHLGDRPRRELQALRARTRGHARALGRLLEERLRAVGQRAVGLGHPFDAGRRLLDGVAAKAKLETV